MSSKWLISHCVGMVRIMAATKHGTLTFVIEDSRKETKSSYYLNDYVDGQANTEDCYISIV